MSLQRVIADGVGAHILRQRPQNHLHERVHFPQRARHPRAAVLPQNLHHSFQVSAMQHL